MTELLPLDPDELLSTTRAVRKRLDLDRPVPLEVVREALAVALQAPSGGNAQQWHWIVLTDSDLKAQVAALYNRSYDAYRAARPATTPAQRRMALHALCAVERLCRSTPSGGSLRDGRRHDRHRPPEGERGEGGSQRQAIGRSRGGLTTKIVALVDALGNLVRFVLLPGQRHDTVDVAPLIQDVSFGALLGGKVFDVDWLRAELDSRGAAAVIPSKANRKTAIAHDKVMYRWRHLIENVFAKLKEFRAVATRYDRTDESFQACIHLAAAIIAAR